MVGRDIKPVKREAQARRDSTPVLEVDDLWAEGDRGITAVRGVSLTVQAGEIAAIAGVAGNGQRELAEAITGLRPYTKGSVRVGGRPVRAGDARSAFKAGVSYVPEDRLGTGVAPSLSIAMNLALKSFRADSRRPVPSARGDAGERGGGDQDVEIKASGPDRQTDYLSGGNLQKVVIAREFGASRASSLQARRLAVSTSLPSSRCTPSCCGPPRAAPPCC